jgi:hypothetical protein
MIWDLDKLSLETDSVYHTQPAWMMRVGTPQEPANKLMLSAFAG